MLVWHVFLLSLYNVVIRLPIRWSYFFFSYCFMSNNNRAVNCRRQTNDVTMQTQICNLHFFISRDFSTKPHIMQNVATVYLMRSWKITHISFILQLFWWRAVYYHVISKRDNILYILMSSHDTSLWFLRNWIELSYLKNIVNGIRIYD